jgi:hypothetical protein
MLLSKASTLDFSPLLQRGHVPLGIKTEEPKTVLTKNGTNGKILFLTMYGGSATMPQTYGVSARLR